MARRSFLFGAAETFVLALVCETVVFIAAVAIHHVARKVRAAYNMAHQSLGVGRGVFAMSKWTRPIVPAMMKFAVKDEEVQRHGCDDPRLFRIFDQGTDLIDTAAVVVRHCFKSDPDEHLRATGLEDGSRNTKLRRLHATGLYRGARLV